MKDKTFGIYLEHLAILDWPAYYRGAKNIWSARMLEMIIESPLNFIYSRRKGKIQIKPFKEKENGRGNQIRVRESIIQGEVLTSLISVVLNGNHLVRFAIRMLAFVICFLRVIEKFKRKRKRPRKSFLLGCLQYCGSCSYIS